MDSDPWLQRYGGHLALLTVGLLLFLGGRALVASQTFEFRPLPAATVGVTALTSSQVQGTPVAIALPVEQPITVMTATLALPVLMDTGLAPVPNPNTFRGKAPAHSFQTYTVERGDTPGVIADQFGIKPETLLGGNPALSHEANLLQVGAELVILPVDGALHTVQPGDTLESIAAQYDIPVEEIIAYGPNNLEFPFRLIADTQLLVPGAVVAPFIWEPPSLAAVSGNSPEVGAGFAPLVVGTGTFIWPVSGRGITTNYWYGHPGIDVGLAEGSGVFASDTGTVTFASWNIYCFGNLIVINHGNGYETFYAHLSGINVYPGQVVTQGQYIGASGNTGCSSGPHIHFEIRINGFRDNPLFYLP
jgi:LysM repeat protein